MRHITPAHMLALTDELSKEGGVMDYLRRARSAVQGAASKIPGGRRTVGYLGRELGGSHYGRQLALGAGVGGVGGALAADEGQGLKGAVGGAALGAGVAGGRILSTKAGREAARTGASNFLQRQRYGITGGGVKDIEHARKIGLIPKKVDSRGMLRGGESRKAVNKALNEQRLNEHAFNKGYLSAPGTVHGLLSNPVDTLKSGWKRSGLMGKGFAGLGAYEAAKGFTSTPEEGGPGRLERGMRGVGSTLGWMVAPTTLLGGQLVGEGAGWVGGKLGRGADTAGRLVRKPEGV